MPLSREKYFLRKTSILHFLPQNYLPFGTGVIKFTVLVSLPYRCYIPFLVKIGPVVLEKKMLTDDGGRQPIAMGHLSYTGKLKIVSQEFRNTCQREYV